MKEKNQAEWIYEVLGKKKGILGASIRELTDADEKKIREEMLRYWKEHNDESTEFLVNGAVLCCSRGSDYSTLDSADHGVYTDSSEMGALANTGDKKFDGFVSCSKWNEEPLVSKHICRFKLGEWRNVRKSVTINGKYALDTNSYLPCKHGGIISPVTSGQEYTLSKSYNKYPKFLNDDGSVDELIVKKLLLRNVSVMKESEIDALIKLGIYLCVCEDVEILKKIINCGYTVSKYYLGIQKDGWQCTLLENFIFASGWAEACCRFSASINKVPIVQNSSWDKYGAVCALLKNNNKNFNTVVGDERQINSNIENMLLNLKLLETMIAAGNLYETSVPITSLNEQVVPVKGAEQQIKFYNLEYADAQMDKKIVRDNIGYINGSKPGFNKYIHKVHLFSYTSNKANKSMKDFISDVLNSIGASISGPITAINYGTALVSIMMANPIFSLISAPVGIICTVTATTAGVVDADRSDSETEYSKVLAIKSINECINMSHLSSCLGLYTAHAIHEIKQPTDNSYAWSEYEGSYKGKKDQKARNAGFATKDKLITSREEVNKTLGLGYSYNISVIEGGNTRNSIRNFNNNMKNIRISKNDGNGKKIDQKTISEGEGLGEFEECNDLKSLINYMNTKINGTDYIIDILDVVGVNGSDIPGRIVYKFDDGTEKVIYEDDFLNLPILFKDNSL